MKKNIKLSRKQNKDGTTDITMICKICGQPIDHATDMGPFCKNMCTKKSGIFTKLKKCKLINTK